MYGVLSCPTATAESSGAIFMQRPYPVGKVPGLDILVPNPEEYGYATI
jgi:hypothetical protein